MSRICSHRCHCRSYRRTQDTTLFCIIFAIRIYISLPPSHSHSHRTDWHTNNNTEKWWENIEQKSKRQPRSPHENGEVNLWNDGKRNEWCFELRVGKRWESRATKLFVLKSFGMCLDRVCVCRAGHEPWAQMESTTALIATIHERPVCMLCTCKYAAVIVVVVDISSIFRQTKDHYVYFQFKRCSHSLWRSSAVRLLSFSHTIIGIIWKFAQIYIPSTSTHSARPSGNVCLSRVQHSLCMCIISISSMPLDAVDAAATAAAMMMSTLILYSPIFLSTLLPLYCAAAIVDGCCWGYWSRLPTQYFCFRFVKRINLVNFDTC